ncbi:hypothetical protein MFRU_032g00980 [Monilinia fructicola]|nr:hypothetical protein MFRU_032g00980 [Monilinia fructicola]
MQKNQIIAMLLSFVFVLMFVMIFITMRLVNVFAHKMYISTQKLPRSFSKPIMILPFRNTSRQKAHS